ncbi:Uncharacterized protein OBRU01_05515 [Operophtera brumata]|uniref:Transmembrane protein 169 n=1 Tax=Operophtera brumata TaxID=104452 RepID=A0A0L7L7Q4_OPEBR|nr:Uncharacterized protein OBRU01_05515 [Operophtera brumata]
MKINLSNINAEDLNENPDDAEKVHIQKNGYQALSTNTSRELVDLSPIYENSSDACSSHGDLRENDDLQKSCKVLNEINECTSATPNSLSQTQSENSFEMGNLSDSLRSAKKKKKVNIVSELHDAENTDSEITGLKMESECGSITGDCSLTDSKDGYLTMTGTIKRGKKKGQQIDVKLNISREELEIIEAAIVAEEYEKMDISKCSLRNGPHIFLFTMCCLPFVALVSAGYSFYIGTLAWYNIFLNLADTFTWKTILLLPIVVMLYPFLIVIFNIGIGLYAGIVQLTFSSVNWWMGVCDFEKGFYGWLCNAIGMSDCSPYEVVILMDVKA